MTSSSPTCSTIWLTLGSGAVIVNPSVDFSLNTAPEKTDSRDDSFRRDAAASPASARRRPRRPGHADRVADAPCPPSRAESRPPEIAAKIVPGLDAFVKDPRTRATQVFIAHPAAGVWRLRALPGSTVTGVEQAQVDERPTVQAGVGGSGEQRTLGYLYQPQPMHTTRFVEEGGKDEQELGVADGRPCKDVKDIHPDFPLCGELHFVPAAGPAGPRRIYAVTTMGGMETRRELVATYDAPPEREPSEVPSLIVRRVPEGLRIGFAGSDPPVAVARPVDYDVDVNLSNGRKLLDVLRSRTHQVTVTGVDADVGAKVAVSALRSDDTLGKTRDVTLAPEANTAASS